MSPRCTGNCDQGRRICDCATGVREIGPKYDFLERREEPQPIDAWLSRGGLLLAIAIVCVTAWCVFEVLA